MMHLADEVHAEIQAFVSGRTGARELEGWLDSVAAEVHAGETPDLRALTDRAYSVLAEASRGDRTVQDARRELAGLISETDPANPVQTGAKGG
jgi:hypothetical protein